MAPQRILLVDPSCEQLAIECYKHYNINLLPNTVMTTYIHQHTLLVKGDTPLRNLECGTPNCYTYQYIKIIAK
jgi:hypothetical protein